MLTNTPCPDFSLNDSLGQTHHLSDYHGRIVILNFWSADCPWSERADAHLAAIRARFPEHLTILPIASNLNETLTIIEQTRQLRGTDLVLIDNNCHLANSWNAQTTPHAFVIDPAGILRYQGAVDDVTFRKRSPEHFYVEDAVLALLSNRLPALQETQPYGCTIVRAI
ncbi:MAG: redoxin domain-containing protein [Chloroflexota bacterium]